MRRLLPRFLILITLVVCLSYVSSVRADPPCPLNCYANCHALVDDCNHECQGQPGCEDKCKEKHAPCFAYCLWVCGPE